MFSILILMFSMCQIAVHPVPYPATVFLSVTHIAPCVLSFIWSPCHWAGGRKFHTVRWGLPLTSWILCQKWSLATQGSPKPQNHLTCSVGQVYATFRAASYREQTYRSFCPQREQVHVGSGEKLNLLSAWLARNAPPHLRVFVPAQQ